MDTTLASGFKKARLLSGLSQEKLSKKLGLSAKTISAYETGRAIPPAYTLTKMSTIMKVPINEIFGLDNESSKIDRVLAQNEEIKSKLTKIESLVATIILKNEKSR